MDNALTDYPILEEEKTYTLEEYLALEEKLWRITTVRGLQDSLWLETLDAELSMADIYYQVDFSEEVPEE